VLATIERGTQVAVIEDHYLLEGRELGMDSLDKVEILMELEEEFDIEISDDVAVRIDTVTDVLAIVGELINGAGAEVVMSHYAENIEILTGLGCRVAGSGIISENEAILCGAIRRLTVKEGTTDAIVTDINKQIEALKKEIGDYGFFGAMERAEARGREQAAKYIEEEAEWVGRHALAINIRNLGPNNSTVEG
jgi:acyl carrier protein